MLLLLHKLKSKLRLLTAFLLLSILACYSPIIIFSEAITVVSRSAGVAVKNTPSDWYVSRLFVCCRIILAVCIIACCWLRPSAIANLRDRHRVRHSLLMFTCRAPAIPESSSKRLRGVGWCQGKPCRIKNLHHECQDELL